MLVNADFSLPAIVTPSEYDWVDSPQPGVARVMLDRVGAEKARATSIVCYVPGSVFPVHAHTGGEEILVLSGTFSDEEADYPVGCYLRNPPGSRHAPFSVQGATIFVKLWQMLPAESEAVRVDTRDASSWKTEGKRQVCSLFRNECEYVRLQRLAPLDSLFDAVVDGAEVLVLEGRLGAAQDSYEAGTWLRLPPGFHRNLSAGAEGATVYLKTGPLGQIMEELR